MNPRHVACVVCLLMLLPAGAAAQQPSGNGSTKGASGRAYKGLFGPILDPNAPQTLVLSASVFEGWDENPLSGDTSRPRPVASSLAGSGYYSGADAELQYDHTGDRLEASLSGGAAARYYPELSGTVPMYHDSAEVSTKLGQRMHVQLQQSFVYTPNFHLNAFPGMDDLDTTSTTLIANSELDQVRRMAYRNAGAVDVGYDLTQRTSLEFGYAIRYVDFVESAFSDFRDQLAFARYNDQLTAHATLHLGYGYRRAAQLAGGTPPTDVHNLDIGVDYSRALSLSRRTTLSFSTGSAIAGTDTGLPDSGPRARLHLTGSAQLTHDMGRTWTSEVDYQRAVRFTEGIADPLLVDAGTAMLNGYLSRRTDVTAQLLFAHAGLISAVHGGYTAGDASAQIRFALSRVFAVYARYGYARFTFSGAPLASLDAVPQFRRNGVRVGLQAAVPLIR